MSKNAIAPRAGDKFLRDNLLCIYSGKKPPIKIKILLCLTGFANRFTFVGNRTGYEVIFDSICAGVLGGDEYYLLGKVNMGRSNDSFLWNQLYVDIECG